MTTLHTALRSLLLSLTTLAGLSLSAQSPAAHPVTVSAEDLITKVYGVASPALSQEEMAETVAADINLVPSAEDDNLWLDSEDGYSLSYSAMRPEVSAVACFEADSLTNYAYFFIFPYEGSRQCANDRQAEFCGCLLQELADLGLQMGLDTTPLADNDVQSTTVTLFNVCAQHGLDIVDVTLQEQPDVDGGRFLVTLNVAPGGASDANILWAAN